MKRTGEIVLGIIGAICYGFGLILGAVLIWVGGSEEGKRIVFEESMRANPALDPNTQQVYIDSLGIGGWLVLILSLIAIVLGIVAMVFLKNNRKPKVAGIIFLSVSILFTLGSFFLLILPGIFYLIAGIMCLARKAKNETNEPSEDSASFYG